MGRVILICTLRDFWDPDSRGGKNTKENQREREKKKKEREKGHQWGDIATGRAATAPLPPWLGGSGGWQEVAGGGRRVTATQGAASLGEELQKRRVRGGKVPVFAGVLRFRVGLGMSSAASGAFSAFSASWLEKGREGTPRNAATEARRDRGWGEVGVGEGSSSWDKRRGEERKHPWMQQQRRHEAFPAP